MHNKLITVLIVGFILYIFIGFLLYTVDYIGNPTYDCPNGVTIGGVLAPTLISEGCVRKPFFSPKLFNFLILWLPESIPAAFENVTEQSNKNN